MKIEALVWLLREIKSGNNTLYLLRKKKSSIIVDYLNYARRNGFITVKKQEDPRRKKIYSLTEKGRKFLGMFE